MAADVSVVVGPGKSRQGTPVCLTMASTMVTLFWVHQGLNSQTRIE